MDDAESDEARPVDLAAEVAQGGLVASAKDSLKGAWVGDERYIPVDGDDAERTYGPSVLVRSVWWFDLTFTAAAVPRGDWDIFTLASLPQRFSCDLAVTTAVGAHAEGAVVDNTSVLRRGILGAAAAAGGRDALGESVGEALAWRGPVVRAQHEEPDAAGEVFGAEWEWSADEIGRHDGAPCLVQLGAARVSHAGATVTVNLRNHNGGHKSGLRFHALLLRPRSGPRRLAAYQRLALSMILSDRLGVSLLSQVKNISGSRQLWFP